MRSNFIVSKHAVWSFTGRNRETERDFSAEPPESTGIPLAYTNARTQTGQKTEILRISGGIPDICEFRPIAFEDENASEKTPPRERRARQNPHSRTLQNFGHGFTTQLCHVWILSSSRRPGIRTWPGPERP